MRTRSGVSFSIVLLSLITGACNDPARVACDESKTRVSKNDRTLGFTASDALDGREQLSGVLVWGEEPSWLAFGQAGEAQLSIELDYDDSGSLNLTDATGHNLISPDATYCLSHLESSVELRLRTEDGVLDEVVQTSLRVYTPELVELRGEPNVDELGGTFNLPQDVGLQVRVDIEDGQLTGSLRAWRLESTETGSRLRQTTMASWAGEAPLSE